MDVLTDPLFMRAVERVVTIIGAIIFGLLGYKLFVAGVKSSDSRFEAKSKSYEFILSGKAPGLFFMLFSSIILVVSLNTGGATRETITAEKGTPPEIVSDIRTEIEQDVRRQIEIQRIERESRQQIVLDNTKVYAAKAAELERKNLELLKKIESLENELNRHKK